MSEHEITPERLDGLMDGTVTPEDQLDRDMLALAADLRAAAPGASDALRERILALPEPQPVGRWRRLVSTGRGRALVAAPALGAIIAAVVTVGVLNRDGGDGAAGGGADASGASAPAAAQKETATQPGALAPPAATRGAGDASAPEGRTAGETFVNPGPARVVIPPGALAATLEEATRIVTDAGGELQPTTQPTDPPSVLLEITVPEGAAERVAAELAKLGTTSEEITVDAGVGMRLILAEEE